MRLICTLTGENGEENPFALSYYLTSQGIANQCEEVLKASGGKPSYHIWVVEEDDVGRAMSLIEDYKKNPHDPKFKVAPKIASTLSKEQRSAEAEEEKIEKAQTTNQRLLSPSPYGIFTMGVLIACIALFFWSSLQNGEQLAPKIPGVREAPLFPPLEKQLLIDYPHYFELRDELLKAYPKEAIEQKDPPSEQALQLMNKMKTTTYWMGIYERFIQHFKTPNFPLFSDAPLFEKIQAGEYWRLISPAFLHYGFLHIFFNILWLVMLGNQIEFKLGPFRTIVLFILTAIVSNVAQYLMSGPFFLGLSGVICGYAGFIFARQQVAPWEGYLLNRMTLIFLGIFVFGMFALQLVFFILQLAGNSQLTISIANTAHIAGALTGYLLGRMKSFALHPRA